MKHNSGCNQFYSRWSGLSSRTVSRKPVKCKMKQSRLKGVQIFKTRHDDMNMETIIVQNRSNNESMCWDSRGERITLGIGFHIKYKPESHVLRLIGRKIHIKTLDSISDTKQRGKEKSYESSWDIGSLIRLPSQVYMQRH